MEYNEKKLWRAISAIGLFLSIVSCVMSLIQFIISGRYEISSFLDYVNIAKNIVFFMIFLYLQFDSSNYKLYTIFFYFYGTVSFIDNVNNLGAVYVVLSFAILYALGYVKKSNSVQIVLFSILPIVALFSQAVLYNKVVFFQTLLHLLTFSFLIIVVMVLFFPRFKEANIKNRIKFLNPNNCSKRDLRWLQSVAKGTRYIEIARQDKVSESKVKNRMLELYALVGTKSKMDFIAMYHDFTFLHSDTAPTI